MKINKDFKLRKVAGETIIVNQGESNTNLTNIISFNSTSEVLWNALNGKDFTKEDAAKVLVDTYGIDSDKAQTDANSWVEKLVECGLIVE